MQAMLLKHVHFDVLDSELRNEAGGTRNKDVDAVSFVLDRPGESAHVLALFQNDRLDTGACKQLVGYGQACRTGADNDGFFLPVHTEPVTGPVIGGPAAFGV